MHKLLIVPAVLVATAAFAGMYDQAYALVVMGAASEGRKEARLAITSVDGVSIRNPRQTDPISPGKHRIGLHFDSARRDFRPESLDIELELEACTRYHIVASYETKSGPNWKPKVYSEPIGECRKKFSNKEAATK
jgi:hypothetical protein